MGLYRAHGKPEFTPRDVRIAHIVLTEIPWLHEQGWPEDRGTSVPHLSRRSASPSTSSPSAKAASKSPPT